MKSAGKARNNGLYRHIRTSKEIIRNLLNDYMNILYRIFVRLARGGRDVFDTNSQSACSQSRQIK